MCLRKVAWGLDWATGRGCFKGCGDVLGYEVESSVRKRKEVTSCDIKGNEKVPSQAKSKGKTMESTVEGAPKKNLLASARDVERVEV